MSKRDRLDNANAAGCCFIAKDGESECHNKVSPEKGRYISGPGLEALEGNVLVFGDAWKANRLPLQIEWSRLRKEMLVKTKIKEGVHDVRSLGCSSAFADICQG